MTGLKRAFTFAKKHLLRRNFAVLALTFIFCLGIIFAACSNPVTPCGNIRGGGLRPRPPRPPASPPVCPAHAWSIWEKIAENKTRRDCTVSICDEFEIFVKGTGSINSGGLGMMMKIPAGGFIMGSPDDEAGRKGEPGENSYEGPLHLVILSQPFHIGQTMVTRAQWKAVTGIHIPPEWAPSGSDNRPATTINWYEAIIFANRLSIQTPDLTPAYEIQTPEGVWSTDPDSWGNVPTSAGADANRWNRVRMIADSNGYRLPTEAQWEYAARAGTRTAFSDGITNDYEDPAVHDLACFWGSAYDLKDVGLLPQNTWGMQDMHGNAWEWIWDWGEPYTADTVTDPVGPDEGAVRMLRGGTWARDASHSRSARRNDVNPWDKWYDTGFRLVRPVN